MKPKLQVSNAMHKTLFYRIKKAKISRKALRHWSHVRGKFGEMSRGSQIGDGHAGRLPSEKNKWQCSKLTFKEIVH